MVFRAWRNVCDDEQRNKRECLKGVSNCRAATQKPREAKGCTETEPTTDWCWRSSIENVYGCGIGLAKERVEVSWPRGDESVMSHTWGLRLLTFLSN